MKDNESQAARHGSGEGVPPGGPPAIPLLHRSLPRLEILPLDCILLHEFSDPLRVEKLCKTLTREGILRNPAVVATCGATGKYVVLDGANRVTALREMGFRDILVQLVDYRPPGVTLDSWHHMLASVEPESFAEQVRRLPGVAVNELDKSEGIGRLSRDTLLALVVFRRARTALAVDSHKDLMEGTGLLCQLTELYRGKHEICRITREQMDEVFSSYACFTTLVMFRRYKPQEIVDLSLNSVHLPAGISRHVIQGRAVGVDLSLELLSSSDPLHEKNLKLQTIIHEKLARNVIRYYPESTFAFDE